MRISVLTPDLSDNSLGRAYLLARLVQSTYEVEIVGPAYQGKIWEPLAGQNEVDLRVVPARSPFHNTMLYPLTARESITGDVIYSSKPLLTSYGAGLAEKLSRHKPLVLDIDDWQLGFQKEALSGLDLVGKVKHLAFSTLCPCSPSSYWNSLLGERLVGYADQITVSNNFLRDRFGGTIVWHARDTDSFDPEKFDRYYQRDQFGIPREAKVVMFLGTPRPHKGIEDLVEALSLLRGNRLLFMLVGLGEDAYSSRVEALLRDRLPEKNSRLVGAQPFARIPEFLASSDLVVIPQRKNRATMGQVPAKVFDAMAMAKPIIATRVCDLPHILDGCGWVVDPERPEQLAQAIRYACDHGAEAEATGRKARQKCVEQYSWHAMRRILLRIFRSYE